LATLLNEHGIDGVNFDWYHCHHYMLSSVRRFIYWINNITTFTTGKYLEQKVTASTLLIS
jgi:hypothetical protein